MRLDVILPTFNRHQLLKRALDSLLAAEVPADLSVFVTVVDNNSSDATRETVEIYQSRFCGRLRYVFEKLQGRSYALNAGILATNGDLIAMIDDDEWPQKDWIDQFLKTAQQTGADVLQGSILFRKARAADGHGDIRRFSGVVVML